MQGTKVLAFDTCCAAPVAVGLIESETGPAAALICRLANPVGILAAVVAAASGL